MVFAMMFAISDYLMAGENFAPEKTARRDGDAVARMLFLSHVKTRCHQIRTKPHRKAPSWAYLLRKICP